MPNQPNKTSGSGFLDFNVVRAISRRDLGNYLANPAGYVFLTLFIAGTAAGAFLSGGFFGRNLADLAELNGVMPAILMLFVPALTMNAWSEERRTGTDELLLTLPVRDSEVVLGKFLGALGIYTVALAFALAHVGVLAFLGEPDPGLLFSTYLGYWLMGALMVSIGLLASLVTPNATVAFIFGVVGCAALVFAPMAPWAAGIVGTAMMGGVAALIWLVVRGETRGVGTAGLIGGSVALALWLPDVWPGFEDAFSLLGVGPRFANFGEGIIRLGDMAYFAGGIGVLLYLCTFLLGRRHW